jgi:hypothetical protein
MVSNKTQTMRHHVIDQTGTGTGKMLLRDAGS